jgi:hypothetical protein
MVEGRRNQEGRVSQLAPPKETAAWDVPLANGGQAGSRREPPTTTEALTLCLKSPRLINLLHAAAFIGDH